MQRSYAILKGVSGALNNRQDCGSHGAGMLLLNHGRQTTLVIALVFVFVFVFVLVLSRFRYGGGMGAHYLKTRTTNNIANATLGVSSTA